MSAPWEFPAKSYSGCGMDFYSLTSFTVEGVEAFLAGNPGVAALGVGRLCFQDGEKFFGEELGKAVWLERLYQAAFGLAARGHPDALLFWPARPDLRRVLRRVGVGGDLKSVSAFVTSRYPEPDMLMTLASIVWLRSHLQFFRMKGRMEESLLGLGRKILADLPLEDRSLAVLLDESGFRGRAGDDWPLAVGAMFVKVQKSAVDGGAVDFSPRIFANVLIRVPASNWNVLVAEIKSCGELFRDLGGLRASERVEERVVERGLCKDLGEFGVPNYVLQALGCPVVLPEEFDSYRNWFSSFEDDVKEAIRYEGAMLLALKYLEVVARYGFLGGFLDGVGSTGVLRAYLSGFSHGFLAVLPDLLREGMFVPSVLEGSFVFRLGVSRKLWDLFSYDRAGMSYGKSRWDVHRSLANEFELLEKDGGGAPSMAPVSEPAALPSLEPGG